MKKLYTILSLSLCAVILQSGVNNSGVPPTGRTGATGTTCISCHSGHSPNTPGGSVTITGLPTAGYIPGTVYPFSLDITHATADRKKWGFSIKAVNSSGSSIGTFSSSNTNAANNGSELSHKNAPSTAAGAAAYTFNNLNWTAPATASGPVTFYYVGLACNGTGGTGGDYVYSGVSSFTLPIKLKSFTATNDRNIVLLNWQTAGEVNSSYFDVERSDDGQFFFSMGKVLANKNTSAVASYSFADAKAASRGGNIFYRLKMVDIDGSSKYSNTISIKPNAKPFAISNIYPTIIKAGDRINVETVSDKNKVLEIAVIDELGKVYSRQSLNLTSGENNFKIAMPSSLPQGMIFVKFNTDNFQQTESLIVR